MKAYFQLKAHVLAVFSYVASQLLDLTMHVIYVNSGVPPALI